MKNDPRVYLARILERIDRVREYTAAKAKRHFLPIRAPGMPSSAISR